MPALRSPHCVLPPSRSSWPLIAGLCIAGLASLPQQASAARVHAEASDEDEDQPPEATWKASIEIQRCEAEALTLPKQTETAMGSVYIVRAGDAQGSAVAISKDGFVLTAAHVIEGHKKVELENDQGISYDADVIRADYFNDVALLHVSVDIETKCSPLADTPAGLGADIFALGNPGGEALAFSVSKGIVSSRRKIANRDFLQTDASVNSGNSGGPLLDEAGQVVGIVSWKVAHDSIEGLAFAVPTDTVLDSLDIKLGEQSSSDYMQQKGSRGEEEAEEEQQQTPAPKTKRPPSLSDKQRRKSRLGGGLIAGGSVLTGIGVLAIAGTYIAYSASPSWSAESWQTTKAINTASWVGVGAGVGLVTLGIVIKAKVRKERRAARSKAMLLPTPRGMQIVGRF